MKIGKVQPPSKTPTVNRQKLDNSKLKSEFEHMLQKEKRKVKKK